MHLKRTKTPKIWPIKRKGTKYVVRMVNSMNNNVPVLIALRDILKFAGNRRDVNSMIKLGKIKVNNQSVKDDKYPINLLDNLSLDGRTFKLVIKNKKFAFEDVKGKEAEEKIAKVIGKKMLNKTKLQVNLSGGRNYITKEKINTGDSVVINLKENKIAQVLEFKEGAKVLFISGKHLGEHGKIEKIDDKKIIVKSEEGKVNSELNSLMVVK